MRATLPQGAAALALVRSAGALRGFSDRVPGDDASGATRPGCGWSKRATLTGLALVDRASLPRAHGPGGPGAARANPPANDPGRNYGFSCECSGGGCKWAEFVGAALQDAISEAFDEASEGHCIGR